MYQVHYFGKICHLNHYRLLSTMGWGGMAKGGVPDRWEDYTNKGTLVEGTQFVPFKVPLKEDLLKRVKPGVEKWGLDQLMETLPQLGLVVDLTNTSRYYQCRRLEDHGVQYCKIFTKGHEVPSKEVVEKFYKAIESVEENKVIGVHCTHGLNRTGYVICRYMVEKKGIDPDVAIEAFDMARGHKQERANYLQHLREKAWESEPDGEASEGGAEKKYDGGSREKGGSEGKRGRWSRDREYRHEYPDYGHGGRGGRHESGYENDGQQQYHGHQRDYYDSYYQGQWERRGDGYHGRRGNYQGYHDYWGQGGSSGHHGHGGYYQHSGDRHYKNGWSFAEEYNGGRRGDDHYSHTYRNSGENRTNTNHSGGGENVPHTSSHNNTPQVKDSGISQSSWKGEGEGVPEGVLATSKKSKWKKRNQRKKKKKLIQMEGIF